MGVQPNAAQCQNLQHGVCVCVCAQCMHVCTVPAGGGLPALTGTFPSSPRLCLPGWELSVGPKPSQEVSHEVASPPLPEATFAAAAFSPLPQSPLVSFFSPS